MSMLRIFLCFVYYCRVGVALNCTVWQAQQRVAGTAACGRHSSVGQAQQRVADTAAWDRHNTVWQAQQRGAWEGKDGLVHKSSAWTLLCGGSLLHDLFEMIYFLLWSKVLCARRKSPARSKTREARFSWEYCVQQIWTAESIAYSKCGVRRIWCTASMVCSKCGVQQIWCAAIWWAAIWCAAIWCAALM